MSPRLFFAALITKINLCPKFPYQVCINLENSTRHLSRNVRSAILNTPVHTAGIPFATNMTNIPQINPAIQCSRTKHTKSKKPSKNTEEDEEEEEYYETAQDDDSNSGKDVSVRVASLRLDAVLKTGFALSRNKVEEYFYQSRVRVNDEKVLKKSVQVTLGDSIDIVRGINSSSDRYIDVMRLRITGIRLPNDPQSKLELKVKRDKLLTIENYEKAWNGDDISL